VNRKFNLIGVSLTMPGGIIDPAFDALKGATVGALAINGYSPLRNPDPVRQPGGGMCYPASHIIMTNKCEDG